MKNIIKFIIDQKLELDKYSSIAPLLAVEFNLSLETAEDIMNIVIDWENNLSSTDTLEVLLNKKFPDIVTN